MLALKTQHKYEDDRNQDHAFSVNLSIICVPFLTIGKRAKCKCFICCQTSG